MSARLDIRRIRLKVIVSEQGNIIDVFTGSSPFTWDGNAAAFELGFFVDEEVASLAQIASIKLEILNSDRKGNALVRRVIAQDKFNLNLTAEEFEAGTAEHLRIKLTSEDTTRLTDDDGNEKGFWLVLSCLTTAVPADEFTFGGTTFTILRDGTGGNYTPPTPTESYYTREDSDARYMALNPDGANFRLRDGKYLQLWDYGTSAWRDANLRNGALEIV